MVRPMSDETPRELGSVEAIELQEEMERSFLDYAMSVIVARALPAARDGLKPVHRRILYGMFDQGLRPDRPHAKCARITGDVMGKYHPHGDSAIYDALVRMAQPFSLRHPLVDFHGNYGSQDFEPAAARYTECRLGALAMQLLAGVDEGTVDMVANYDGREQEPFVLPARFPNLLVNGSQGIAVGMATNIPPHNLGEIIDAVNHVIDHPDATPDDLMEFVKGPDFPTGAFILGRGGIMDAYRTGRGSIRMRARAEIVEGRQGDEIIVSELPYQTSVSTVASKIEELVTGRQIEGIRDVRNLSAGLETKLVIYLKRDASANVVLNNLYKHTPLQTSFGVNMVALVDGVPRTLDLGEIREKFAAPRRAEITFDPGEIDLEDLIEDEDLVVTLSRNGYVKSVAADAFRTQGRGGRGVQAAKLRDNDYVAHLLTTTAHSYLLFFSNRGKVYRLKAHEIPMKDRTARGTAIVNLLPLAPDERIAAVIDTRTYEDGRYLFFATN